TEAVLKSHMLAMVAVGAAGLGAVLFARGPSPVSESKAAAPPVPEQRLAADGRVVTYPGAEVVIGAGRTGRLLSLPLREGQAGRRGALVAEFDSRDIRASLAQASALVSEAEEDVHAAELLVRRREQLAVEKIGTELELEQASHDLAVARARLETRHAEVAL